MKKIELYEFQMKQIQNALRMASNLNSCHEKTTSYDRCITQALKFSENALNENINEIVER